MRWTDPTPPAPTSEWLVERRDEAEALATMVGEIADRAEALAEAPPMPLEEVQRLANLGHEGARLDLYDRWLKGQRSYH